MNELVILDGATGSGKSTLLEYARAHPTGRYSVPTKLTTRERRPTDNDWEFSFHRSLGEQDRRLVWEAVGARYAVDLDEIEAIKGVGSIPILVCTDVNVIGSLRSHFDVIHLYIYRHLSPSEVAELLDMRSSPESATSYRIEELARIPEDYRQRVTQVSSTILNVGAVENLYGQFDAVIDHFTRPAGTPR